MPRSTSGAADQKADKKEVAKSFLNKKAEQAAAKDQAGSSVKKEEGVTKKVVEAKAPIKEKKEAILANAREKMGISEEKREDFKKRSAEVKAKREEKSQSAPSTTKSSSAPAATTATDAKTSGPLKREDMDPTRSVMAQRVERQMAKTGATRADARAAVVVRQDAREQQLKKIESEQGVNRKEAVGIMKYGNKTAVAPEGGGAAVANYQLAKRVVDMAKNKNLTRSEAAGVISSRQKARAAAAAPTTTTTATETTAATTPVDTAAVNSPAATTATTPAVTGTAATVPGRLLRKDMDPNRSVMAQRVEQQMAKTGATRADARGAVVARRDAREQQLKKIQSEQGVGRGQAVGIMKYGNKTAVVPEGGGAAVANYQQAKRVVQMAQNKGLTRSEAAGVISSRQQARKKQSQTTPPAA